MIRQMCDMEFVNKTVLDFGTGTGILAIFAEKLGAEKITAIDCDEWSIANARENIQTNNCKEIKLVFSHEISSDQKFEIILANINKNVIIENMNDIRKQLALNGQLVISGLLQDDETEILEKAKQHSLLCKNISYRDKWICICFTF